MKPNWSNVFMISLGLILLATASLSFYMAHNKPMNPQELVGETWLPIPDNGMDASKYYNRMSIRSDRQLVEKLDLINTCGDENTFNEFDEIYIFRTYVSWGPTSIVILKINGDNVILSNQNIAGFEKQFTKLTDYGEILLSNFEKPKLFKVHRSDISYIKDIVLKNGKWLGDSSEGRYATDGMRTTLDACIKGIFISHIFYQTGFRWKYDKEIDTKYRMILKEKIVTNLK